MREGQREIGLWVRLAGGRGGLIGSWVRGAISPVDEVGRSVGGFVAQSHQCLDVRSELSPVLGCAIGEECV